HVRAALGVGVASLVRGRRFRLLTVRGRGRSAQRFELERRLEPAAQRFVRAALRERRERRELLAAIDAEQVARDALHTFERDRERAARALVAVEAFEQPALHGFIGGFGLRRDAGLLACGQRRLGNAGLTTSFFVQTRELLHQRGVAALLVLGAAPQRVGLE